MLVNGHNLYVERHGAENDPAVVLLHHGLGSVRAWKEQIPALVQSGYQVIAYDRWGYGASDARPALDLPSFNTDLQDLGMILAELCTSPADLVGHSDGGTLALYFAAQHPQLVRCMVTVAAHIYFEVKMEPAILAVKQSFDNDQRFRRGLYRAHGEKYQGTFNNWFEGWHRMESLTWDMRPVLAQICCPVMVVQGEADEHATPQHAKDIAGAVQGSELWLVPGASHMLPQEQAGLFNSRLVQYLDKYRDD